MSLRLVSLASLAWLPLLTLACGDPGGSQDVGQATGTATDGTTTETGGETECEDGLIASEDGECHCGTVDGGICGEDAYCDAPTGICVEPSCGSPDPWTPGGRWHLRAR